MPLVDGATRLYGELGDPIDQVRMPGFLNAAWARAGVDAVLVPMRATAADLPAVIAGLRRLGNLDGLILTVPHKQAMLALVDDVLPMGRRIGAINAVRREAEGRWTGEMFDGAGFIAGLLGEGHEPRGRAVLQVGAGGAGSAIAHALADAGVRHLDLFDIDRGRAERLAAAILAAVPGSVVRAVATPDPAGCALVVNATPIGMRAGDPLPVDVARLTAGAVCADVVTKPVVTPFLEAAAKRGHAVLPGHKMAAPQAALFARFFGRPID